MSEFGIDVSHYQGKIDWEKVVRSGRGFVIMKAMYEKAIVYYRQAGAAGYPEAAFRISAVEEKLAQ